ncbi:MAG TPA: hypothetical protein VKK06_03820, partial [Terriglobia bacterium]|nr:hypothetical protein [Terriglobia bacterium]
QRLFADNSNSRQHDFRNFWLHSACTVMRSEPALDTLEMAGRTSIMPVGCDYCQRTTAAGTAIRRPLELNGVGLECM